MLKELKFSIIIPVYNGEKTILKSLEKLLEQNYTNFEILVINDGSQDNTKNIIDELSNSNNFIKVFHKENSGVSGARNFGLTQANGEYILFVDADDELDKNALSIINEYLQNNEVDILIFGINFLYFKNNMIVDRQLKTQEFKKFQIDEIGLNFEELYNENYITPVWNKAIKRSIIANENLNFNTNMHILEDLEYSVRLLMTTQTIMIIPEQLYYYYIDQDEGTLARRRNFDYLNSFNYLNDTLLKFSSMYEESDVEFKNKINNIIFRAYTISLEYDLLTKNGLRSKLDAIKRHVENNNFYLSATKAKPNKKLSQIYRYFVVKKKLFPIFIIIEGNLLKKEIKRRIK